MKITPSPTYQDCKSYVAAHLHAMKRSAAKTPVKIAPAVTISRQTGARGRTIGQKLQNALRARNPKAEIPWTLFDENLVQKVLKDHNLPARLEQFMPDDAVGMLESSINEILGRHPSLWTLFEQSVQTIVRLCRMGHCIIVGRGGNKITEGFSNVIRVRFIGSEETRLNHLVSLRGMEPKKAQQFIKDEDHARRRYLKQNFKCDIDDPMLYDMVINTDHLSDELVVQALVAAVEAK